MNETQMKREAEKQNHIFSDSIGGCSSNYKSSNSNYQSSGGRPMNWGKIDKMFRDSGMIF